MWLEIKRSVNKEPQSLRDGFFPSTNRNISTTCEGRGFPVRPSCAGFMTHAEKALRFQELHKRPGVFLLPNPWDAGSARILAGLGFEALATSSGAAAGTFGRRDGQLTRDEALESVRAIVNATDLPVSGDL